MKLVLRLSLTAIGLLAFASSVIHPYGAVKSAKSAAPLFAGPQLKPEIARIFERSCQNCHSERTEWPWYSYVAPMSWLIERDVHRGRSHMNLSHWDAYTEDQKMELLAKMGVEVRNHRMPLPKYTELHPQARLSDDDVARLYAWLQSERRQLRASIQSKAKPPSD